LDTEFSAREKIKDCLVFNSFEELTKENIDIIFVCTPNLYSPQYCIDSLKMGKHVFCEKPPGRHIEDIKNIIKAEEESDHCKLMFGFNHRFHPGIIRAKVVVDSGRLGKIINIRGLYGKSGGVNFSNSWRNSKAISGGGILLDQGIHMLDLFRYFCGDFEFVKCFLSNFFWKFSVEDNAYVILQNRKGQNAFFHSSATMWKHTFKIDITLENGYMIVEGLLSKTGSYGQERMIIGKRQFEDEADAIGNPAEEVTYFDRDLSWDLEVEEFVNCITEDKPVTNSSSEDAFKVMEIIDKAYKDSNVLLNKWNGVIQK
jgi:predicted dehydrogenase